jgi:hypothetical protein
MDWIRRRRPAPGTIFGFLALLIALGGVGYAAIPDSGGTIHGCYQKNNGSLRVADSSADCRASEQPLSWNQRGPVGPPGPAAEGTVSDQVEAEITVPPLFPSEPAVSAGGPSVTVRVPASGLIAFRLSVEAGLFPPPRNFSFYSNGATVYEGDTAIAGIGGGFAANDFQEILNPWQVVEATPGLHTYTVRYSFTCDSGDPQRRCADTEARFRNRKLWAIPIP